MAAETSSDPFALLLHYLVRGIHIFAISFELLEAVRWLEIGL